MARLMNNGGLCHIIERNDDGINEAMLFYIFLHDFNIKTHKGGCAQPRVGHAPVCVLLNARRSIRLGHR